MGRLLNGVWAQRGHSQKLAKAAVVRREEMSRAHVRPQGTAVILILPAPCTLHPSGAGETNTSSDTLNTVQVTGHPVCRHRLIACHVNERVTTELNLSSLP